MIARKSALIISTRIIDGLIGYIALFFITKYLSPDAYGIVMFAMGFAGLFTIITNLGLDTAHVKKISEGKNEGKCNGTFYTIKIILTVLFVCIVLISLFIWKNVLGRGFETSTHELAIYLMIVYWAIMTLSGMISKSFKAKKEVAADQTSLVISSIVRLLIILFISISQMGAIALAFAYIFGEMAHTILLFILFKRRKYLLEKPSKEYAFDYAQFAFPLVIVVASSLLMKNVDKILIQLFWSATDVGYYAAAYRITQFITKFIASVGILLLPTYSFYHSNKNKSKIIDLTYKSERYMSMLIFPMVFGIITLAEPVTKILLNKWIGVVPILRILPLFALFIALERPYQTQFIGMNQPKLARNRIILMVITNLILNILLIPPDIQSLGLKNMPGLGAMGAVIASVSAYFIGLIYSRIKAYQLTGVKGNWKIVLHGISATIMALVLHLIMDYGLFSVDRWYHLLVFSFFGLGIYLVVLWIFREFTKEDYQFFIETLNLGKMFSYIRDELKKKE